MNILLAIFGLALLMIIHELGHHLAARAFGMRVVRFSIGFGPPLWRYQSSAGGTVYQLALIPFMAYVQIAGMNPLDEEEAAEEGSFAKASLIGRAVTVMAGPFSNYIFASAFSLVTFLAWGAVTNTVNVMPGGAAEAAKLKDGDRIVAIEGQPIEGWGDIVQAVHSNQKAALQLQVERGEQLLKLEVQPRLGPDGKTRLMGVQRSREKLSIAEATELAITRPAQMVAAQVMALGGVITGQIEAELVGPAGMVQEAARSIEQGWGDALEFLGMLSTMLALFNMLPFPALDGGRLCFLTYEAVTRRRANARIEAVVHFVGLVMLLLLVAFVTVGELS